MKKLFSLLVNSVLLFWNIIFNTRVTCVAIFTNVLKAGPWILNSFVAWSKLNSLLVLVTCLFKIVFVAKFRVILFKNYLNIHCRSIQNFFSQSYFCHWVQICFDQQDVHSFLLNFAQNSIAAPILRRKYYKHFSYQPCLETDIHCADPSRMSTGFNTQRTRWSTEHSNMACGKAANYKVFIKAHWWTGKASQKNNLFSCENNYLFNNIYWVTSLANFLSLIRCT